MRKILAATIAGLAACGAAFYTSVAATTQTAQRVQSTAPLDSAPAATGLRDLEAMTFACPKAGLNAAAREAAKAPSEGTYQFSYFRVVNDSHHASYEVHFKSNYQGEPELKYCVAIYCQEGWDPSTTKIDVRLMGAERKAAHGAAHVADCSTKPTPAPRRSK